MKLSNRLFQVAQMVEKCDKIIDVGTDHAYIPIYLVNNKIANFVVASDINEGPIKVAQCNIKKEMLEGKIECRVGSGLSVLKPCEVECGIIAGMGGFLIIDILESGIQVFKKMKYLILQPMQHSDVLRKYIYEKGYRIIDESICISDGKYYETIKIKYDRINYDIDEIYYDISKMLVEKKDAVERNFIDYKIKKYENILKSIKPKTYNSLKRQDELIMKVKKLKELNW